MYEIIENKWDPVKKRGSPTRRCIGLWDPVTETIVPTRKKGSKKKAASQDEPSSPSADAHQEDPDYKNLYGKLLKVLHEKDQTINSLETQLKNSERDLSSLKSEMKTMRSQIQTFLNGVSPFLKEE